MEGSRRPRAASAYAMLLCLAASLSHAEETGTFSFEILPDGTPRFTQVLTWDADPNVLFYEVAVQTAAGKDISVSRVEAPALPLSLGPGRYRYRIVLYNCLRQAELELPWQEFTVLKAEMPRITKHSPAVWFIESFQPRLVIHGENLIPGAGVRLVRSPADGKVIPGTETGRTENSMMTVEFPADSVETGLYALEVKNPGGLFFTVERALLIRHMLPAPAGLAPSPGSSFGPRELRGMKSIRFSWDAVPEATHYVFSLFKGTDARPLIRREYAGNREHTLPDLTVLDKGEYRWTVEALAKDGETIIIPCAKAAEAGFVIDLPQLAAPAMKIGDYFYGR